MLITALCACSNPFLSEHGNRFGLMYLQVALEFVVLLDQPETKKVATNDGEWSGLKVQKNQKGKNN